MFSRGARRDSGNLPSNLSPVAVLRFEYGPQEGAVRRQEHVERYALVVFPVRRSCHANSGEWREQIHSAREGEHPVQASGG